MPQIKLMQSGQPVADFACSGTQVTVAGVTVDVAEHQSESGETIEIRKNGAVAQVGGDGAYLAHIQVPPAQFTEPVHAEDGALIAPAQRLPLDPNTIVITLWPTA